MLHEHEPAGLVRQDREGLMSSEEECFPKVAAIILHYGRAERDGNESLQYTEKCLRSLERIDYPKFHTVILDAGSTDRLSEGYKGGFIYSFPRLRETTPIHFNRNVGCAQGYNVAAEYAMRQGAQYLFLLNNDTEVVNPDILYNMIGMARRFPEAAAIGPKIYDWKDSETQPDVIQFIGGRFYGGILGAHQNDHGQFDQARKVDFLSGAAMLVRAEAIEKIGLFNPRFFVYLEELDFAARAKRAGYEFVYAPGGQVRHKGRHSIDERYGSYAEESARNYMLLIRLHSGTQRLQFAIRAATVIGKSIVGSTIIKHEPRKFIGILAAVSEGLRLELKETKEELIFKYI